MQHVRIAVQILIATAHNSLLNQSLESLVVSWEMLSTWNNADVSPSFPKMNLNGCQHLTEFKAAKGTEPFKIIHSYFIACSSAEDRRRKVFQSTFQSLSKLLFVWLDRYVLNFWKYFALCSVFGHHKVLIGTILQLCTSFANLTHKLRRMWQQLCFMESQLGGMLCVNL